MTYLDNYESSTTVEEVPDRHCNGHTTENGATGDQEAADPSHDHLDDDELKFSITQMCIDFYYLDKSKILWDMVLIFIVAHVLAGYGCYVFITFQCYLFSIIFSVIGGIAGGLGVTMGVHRYWSHQAFKAKLPIQVALMLMNCIAFQESIFIWGRNHRIHHKWSDTDRDFTNSRRGFFFAHMGWKMYEMHPEVYVGRKLVPCNDLLADPIVKFQHDYYYWISIPVAFIIPTLIPVLFWGEPIVNAFTMCVCFRLACTFHFTWCINSVAHLYGYQPYDRSSHAFENKVLGAFALGEGWHNYHHAFPNDYRASEVDGWFGNLTTKVIDFLNRTNQTYDLVTVSDDIVVKRTVRTGNPTLRIPRAQTTF